MVESDWLEDVDEFSIKVISTKELFLLKKVQFK